MNKLDQTIFGEDHGDCFRTCVACILELPLDAVPNFCDVDLYPGDDGEWFVALDEWLQMFNLSAICLSHDGTFAPRGFAILSGGSPRGDFNHSVVAHNGEMVWDPHPSRGGLRDHLDWIVFTVGDPADVAGYHYPASVCQARTPVEGDVAGPAERAPGSLLRSAREGGTDGRGRYLSLDALE